MVFTANHPIWEEVVAVSSAREEDWHLISVRVAQAFGQAGLATPYLVVQLRRSPLS